jgi:hypothetical protein
MKVRRETNFETVNFFIFCYKMLLGCCSHSCNDLLLNVPNFSYKSSGAGGESLTGSHRKRDGQIW